MQMPKITVVTPSFNQAKYIRETIESVLNQNYPNLEYFVVDGGSTDGSVDIIREYENHLDWWISEKDNGQTDAINKGFAKATGDLLCWVGSDDILLPNCLDVVAKNYVRCGKPDLIHSDCLYIDENGFITKMMRVSAQTRFFMMRGVWNAPAPAIFFGASLFRLVGGLNPQYHLSMDVDIWMRMVKAGGYICYIRKYLGAFRWHNTSKSFVTVKERKSKNRENFETRKIFDEALGTVETTRWVWRYIRKLRQIVNLGYVLSWKDTRRYAGLNWKEVF